MASLSFESVKPFVAITAQALQGVDVVHVIAQPPIVRVVDDESTPSAALLASASGIVFHL